MKTIITYIVNFLFSFRFFRNIYSITHGKRKFFDQEKKELDDLGFFEDLNFLIDILKVKNKSGPDIKHWRIEDGDNSRLTYSKLLTNFIEFGFFSNSDDARAYPHGRFAINVDLSGRSKPFTLSFNLYFKKDKKKYLTHKSNNVLQFNIKVKNQHNWNFEPSMVEIIHIDKSDLIWCEEIIKLASEERRYQKRRYSYSENEYNADNILSIDNASDKEELIKIADVLKSMNFIDVFYFFYRDTPRTPLTTRKLFRDFYHQFDDDKFKFHSYFRTADQFCFHQNELKFRYKDNFYKIYFNEHIYGKKEIYDPQNTNKNVIRYIIEKNGQLALSFLSETNFKNMYPDIKDYEELEICDKPREFLQPFSSDRMSIGVLEKFYNYPNDLLFEEEENTYQILKRIKERLCRKAEEKGIDTQEMAMFSDYEGELYQNSLNLLSGMVDYFGSGGSIRGMSNLLKDIDDKYK